MKETEIKILIEEKFKHLHAHPELSYQEVETTKLVKDILQQAGVQVLATGLKTGLIARVGSGEAPVTALRCDIDALPITEQTDLPYKSKFSGKMHACGHDFHTASVLGAALLLKEHEAELEGTVKLIFQPAEEAPGGALDVLNTGVLDDVEAIFGIHTSPLFPVGTVAVREGDVTASVDTFKITFTGKGTHGAHPDAGLDPIVTAAAFVSAVQTIVSRNSDPFASNLISVTHIEAGNTWNVIPETAFAEGTVRTLKATDRSMVRERVISMAEGIAAGFGQRVEVEWIPGPPATDNDKGWAEFAAGKARAAGLTVVPSPHSLGGEDFAYYQEKIKGVFIQIGTGLSASNHNPGFRVDPQALYPTAAYLHRLMQAANEKLRKKR